MTMRSLLRTIALPVLALGLAACVTPPEPKDYSDFRQEDPHSILVLPALNNTVAVEAPEFFLSTISRPFALRGYYVFPANMVKSVLEEDGLSDPSLIYQADTRRLGNLFGCDAALYLSIDKWESQYVVLATQTNVKFNYELRSCETGDVLWQDTRAMSYSPQASSSGNPLADLLAQAVVAAIEKGMPNYIPLAQQANMLAASTVGQGLPAGPYREEAYKKDLEAFPVR
ncbi:GNA1162 family protein [Henriciella sp.]|jgi:hypothetical protein|uniref:DUF799 domain-containing protein n=1 Tax=Henriciella sp. TaxID=1968823 RepID=UPI000C44EEE6|nr:GNA1162 family protein [Henriciella sp.]MAN73639.1 hypothetical protein [Henriciella sp.]MAZ25452.1 hypothetical protein [Cytophagaceae bacterium]|tara:strand:- start:45 stop:728 length:684 start_codon:yes stop_codon:yes gene_type:complete